ncbi:hypothetical protein [Geomonas anaerohicana]|uniref:Uncharacterized protein n=1 Tax=Geomonas anaerohicana TaxID=2798583 RepID=A0ABS0YJC2_9BACT|nr:hypothetical protein [Geomonas anaerohicana]MBJ6752395.1 hypothetical protein [Geomonas anaerohicana]
MSILLPAEAYGREPETAAPPATAAPQIALQPPWLSFVDRFMVALFELPFGASLLTPFEEHAGGADAYGDGSSAPDIPFLTLDLRLNLGGAKEAQACFYDICYGPHGLVLVNFAFGGPVVDAALAPDRGATMPALLPFREFLLALCAACPVLIGTIGVELDALIPDISFDGLVYDRKLSYRDFFHLAWHAKLGDYAFMFVNPAVFDGGKPLVMDRIAPARSFPSTQESSMYRDLLLCYEMVENDYLGEQAYRKMYESNWPKDDKDDALGYLARAISVAGTLELEQYEAELRERYEQIRTVYDAQFRR